MIFTYRQRFLAGMGTLGTLMVATVCLPGFGSEPWHLWIFSGLSLVSVLLVIGWQSLRPKELYAYKGVEIKKFPEWEHSWSTHITGSTPSFRRACVAKLRSWLTFSTDPYPRGAKLFTDKVDRQELERCSLRAFAALLDAVALDPKATVISSSVLNFNDRNPQRLSARIRVVMEHEGHWQYVRIMHTQPVLESLLGRLFWGWKKRPGDALLAMHAPGIVVWHTGRLRPRLPRSIKIIDGSSSSDCEEATPIAQRKKECRCRLQQGRVQRGGADLQKTAQAITPRCPLRNT